MKSVQQTVLCAEKWHNQVARGVCAEQLALRQHPLRRGQHQPAVRPVAAVARQRRRIRLLRGVAAAHLPDHHCATSATGGGSGGAAGTRREQRTAMKTRVESFII